MNQKVFGLNLEHAVLESQDFVRCGIWNAVPVDLIGGCRRGFVAGQAILIPGIYLWNFSTEVLFFFFSP